jgi:antiviral helicase SKI2
MYHRDGSNSFSSLIYLQIDFSDWIGRTKRKPVNVIRTNYRPVPLSHHLYAGLKLHKIMEGSSGFLNKGYTQASNALLPPSEREKKKQNAKKKGTLGGSKQSSAPSYRKSSGSTQSAWQQSGNRQNWTSLVKFLEREGLMPTVVFSFSKKVRFFSLILSLTLS